LTTEATWTERKKTTRQGNEDDEELRPRTFLERHDRIPWIALAIVVGGAAGFLRGV